MSTNLDRFDNDLGIILKIKLARGFQMGLAVCFLLFYFNVTWQTAFIFF